MSDLSEVRHIGAAAGASRLNLIHQNGGAATRGWRLALLAAGLLALLPAGANWLTQWQDVQRLQAQLAQAQPRPASRVVLEPARQRELDLQLKTIAEAVRQLNLPVARLIKTLQAPRDIRVALLSLDLNGQPELELNEAGGVAAKGMADNPAGALKIGAEAETAQDMLNYLAFLNQQTLFKSVYLVKHEMSTTAADHAYRFQLEAQWRQ
ncbi:hypothetical protein ACFOLJ_13335 [Rugamonas sp. CCM 8940]|uniref:hypothetical protein n=1 Tax=Rugamonas sp. CCM 8940 TaxID=2765359 RepID=UPI0018F74121|nr:hypothetical protein [Rugamonas sp. CCM 8940]MBJ7309624.1 hypothetical protein [Rugamonas sp. CCM 8940]